MGIFDKANKMVSAGVAQKVQGSSQIGSVAAGIGSAFKKPTPSTKTPKQPSEGFLLRNGESLTPGGKALTRGNARMVLQSDGNLVITVGGKAVWATKTKGATELTMQPDGNLVLYAGKKALWRTRTNGKAGKEALLDLLPDGSAVVYTKQNGTGIWNSRLEEGQKGLVHEKPPLLPNPVKIIKSAGNAAKDLVTLHVKDAVKEIGKGVNEITGSSIVQAGWPSMAVANVVNGAVTGGKAGAIKAAQSFLKNPVAKATYAAVGVILPPLAPVSAGMVAGMETMSRVIDGLESGDPKVVAAAALQLASTAAQASDGIPGAQRALEVLDQTQKARDVVNLIHAGDKDAIAAAKKLKEQAAAGDKKAQDAKHKLDVVMTREAFKKPAPVTSKAVKKTVTVEQPALAAQVRAALTNPQGVKLGNYTVLGTGRLLLKGKALKHESRHMSKKAYDAYMKTHG